MTVLVTGGCGFVGSNIALSLSNSHLKFDIHEKFDVYCMDNLRRSGSELNLPRLKNKAKFIHGDIRNKEDFPSFPADTIIECSAEPSVMAGVISSPEYLLHTNLLGTINCLEYARKHDSDFIFLSTSRVYPVENLRNISYIKDEFRANIKESQTMYGISQKGISEIFPLMGARTLYGATKLASELLIQEYNDVYGLRTIINRCGLIAGQWQFGKTDQGVITLWLAKHFYNQPLTIYGYNGKQVRDVLNINDLCNLIFTQLNLMPELSGENFNVGGGYQNSVSLNQLTTLCQSLTGNSPKISYSDEVRQGDVPIYISDNAKVTKATSWSPKISVETTLIEILKWIQDNSELLKPILL